MVRAQQEREQQQLIELEREEASLRNQRATVVWVFERTGRSTATATLSPEEEQLQALKSQLIQAQAIYARRARRSACCRPRSPRSRAWSPSSAPPGRCPTPTASRRRP